MRNASPSLPPPMLYMCVWYSGSPFFEFKLSTSVMPSEIGSPILVPTGEFSSTANSKSPTTGGSLTSIILMITWAKSLNSGKFIVLSKPRTPLSVIWMNNRYDVLVSKSADTRTRIWPSHSLIAHNSKFSLSSKNTSLCDCLSSSS